MAKRIVRILTIIVMTVIFPLLLFTFWFVYYNRVDTRLTSEIHNSFIHAVKLQLDTEAFYKAALKYRYGDGESARTELEKALELILLRLDAVRGSDLWADVEYNDTWRKLEDIFSWCQTLLNNNREIFTDHYSQLMMLLDDAVLMEQDLVHRADILSQRSISHSLEKLKTGYFRAVILISLSLLCLSTLLLMGMLQRDMNVKLSVSEDKFRIIFNESYHFIGILNTRGIVCQVNRSALNFVDRIEEDILGKEVGETPWWNQTTQLQEKIRNAVRLAQKGRDSRFEAIHKDKRGKHIIADVSVKPVMNRKNELAHIIVEGWDITEIREGEEKLERMREHLFHIINSLLSRIIVVDGNLKITLVNNKARDELHQDYSEISDKPLFELYPYLKDMESCFKKTMDSIKPCYSRKQREKEGVIILEDITIYPLSENEKVGAVIRIDDVTDIQRMDEMMIQNEKMMSVGGLAAGMAHEINNPLAGMIQASEVIYNRLSHPEIEANRRAALKTDVDLEKMALYMEERNILSMLESIRTSGARAASIVENMLSFARKEGSPVSSHRIDELMEKAIELVSTDYNLMNKYDFRAIELIREYEDDLPLIPCEGVKIQQVFLNILSNGAEAMSKNYNDLKEKKIPCPNPRFILRLALDREFSSIRVEIEDNGPGMEEEVRKRIFDPFFTTKQVGEGTGLGLSVSFFIIRENHGGKINVISEPGKGARFIIHLPLNGREMSEQRKEGLA